jgi:hypothetical protein
VLTEGRWQTRGAMNNVTMLSASPEQPWWYVRSRLILVLAALAAICLALWTDSPVRNWVTRLVIQAEIPAVMLVALNTDSSNRAN